MPEFCWEWLKLWYSIENPNIFGFPIFWEVLLPTLGRKQISEKKHTQTIIDPVQ